ncbi:ROK family protein [Actinokineospora guangxiensis]|uniref:ROK family protein n=1 Tax=Actinokineospora guangxiensis TaxID=1490288 RepID=A0ABW0EQI4_9PSEU
MAVPGTLRALNDAAVLALLIDRGPLTRPQIAEASGLSKPTASQVLTRLTGLVTAEAAPSGKPGRNAEVYRVDPAAATAAAVDVTPKRTTARIVLASGEVIGEHRVETREGGDVVHRLRAAISGAGAEPDRLDHIVIGVPGAVDGTGRLAYAAHLPGWHRPRLLPWLSDALGAEVTVENDVNLVAEAERTTTDEKDFALYWGADGIGAALVLDGRLRRGACSGAGEIGYLPVPGAPTAREVGRTGVHGLQAIAGGAALARLLRSHGFPGPAAKAIRAALKHSAHPAQPVHPVIEEIAYRVALGVAAVVAVVDPGLVVLSGHVVEAGGEPLRARVETALHSLTLPRPAVRLSQVRDEPVLAGAVVLARSKTRETLLARVS